MRKTMESFAKEMLETIIAKRTRGVECWKEYKFNGQAPEEIDVEALDIYSLMAFINDSVEQTNRLF